MNVRMLSPGALRRDVADDRAGEEPVLHQKEGRPAPKKIPVAKQRSAMPTLLFT